jgi:type 1 fimbria pilin
MASTARQRQSNRVEIVVVNKERGMRQGNKSDEEGYWLRYEWRYRLLQLMAVLMVPVVLVSLLALLPEARAAQQGHTDKGNVDGAHGVLRLRGALTESACRLTMTSARQDIDLGGVGSAHLQQVGNQGVPVAIELRLEDCLRSPANNRDDRSGGLLWAPHQPAVSVSFTAPMDANNPKLVRVQGAQGLGLRLKDSQGRDVRLGERGAPLLLVPGQSVLSYSVTPERTQAPLQAGVYSAMINVRFNYD